jgi:hypothetical protein
MDTKSVLPIVAALACLSALPAATADRTGSTGSIDGSATVPCGTSTMLFGGAVPPNGFMVQSAGGAAAIIVNDNGPAQVSTISSTTSGFSPGQSTFTSPPGYKPMGPVSVFAYSCPGSTAYVAARGW